MLRFVLKLFSVFKDTKSIDIYDFNFSLSSKEFGYLNMVDFDLPRRGILIRIISYIRSFSINVFYLRLFRLPDVKEKKIIYFISSNNQYSSLIPLIERTSSCEVIGMNGYGKFPFPLGLAYVISFFFSPIVLFKYFSSQGYNRESFRASFDWYWLVYGIYFVARLVFHQQPNGKFVVANDHCVENRSITKAAQDEGYTTFFAQHASVTKSMKFPILSFDCALLDGTDALKKYDDVGYSKTKVFLVGVPKFDNFVQYQNVTNVVKRIGVCVNSLDIVDRLEEVIGIIKQTFPKISLCIRPHPADKRKRVWKLIAERFNVLYSDSNEELSFQFLRTVDAIIAGESNIHVEAALMNVYPIRYDFSRNAEDIYGFISAGLIDRCYTSAKEIIGLLHQIQTNRPNVLARVKPFCATIDTEYRGRSAELALHVINEYENIINNDGYYSMWIPFNGLKNLAAYQLKNS